MLDREQRERLAPPGRGARLLAEVLQAMARLVMHRWFRLDAAGMENLPERGPCILAPNHKSALDPIALAAVLSSAQRRNTHWGGFTGRMFNTPWMRLVSRAFGVLPVAPNQRPVTSLAYGAAALSRDALLVWFPEGRRIPEEDIGPFRPGIGSLARARQAKVVPCLIRNTGAALPPGSWWPKRRRLVLRIGAAADPATLEAEGRGDEPAERIADAVRRRVLALDDPT
jgi:long-chain acyl-CoA synthetase